MLCYGFTFDLLILVLPTLAGRHILSFLASMVAVSVVESLSDHFLHRVGPKIQWQAERSHLLSGTGKVLTWVVVFVMVCNAVLTSAAMLRYNIRAVHPEPTNAFSAFLDRQYPDSFMETRWPNMIVTDGESSLP